MYKALLANVSVTDLLEKAANIGDVDSARSLMNLVMQFRKVRCSRMRSDDCFFFTNESRSVIIQSFLKEPMSLRRSRFPTSVVPGHWGVKANLFRCHILHATQSSTAYRRFFTKMEVFLISLVRIRGPVRKTTAYRRC